MNQIIAVCADCGNAAAKATFGFERCNPHATWYRAKCGVCKRLKSCTEPRDFGHPDFKLLIKLQKKQKAR